MNQKKPQKIILKEPNNHEIREFRKKIQEKRKKTVTDLKERLEKQDKLIIELRQQVKQVDKLSPEEYKEFLISLKKLRVQAEIDELNNVIKKLRKEVTKMLEDNLRLEMKLRDYENKLNTRGHS